ncbi:uncharacterized protein C8A04DRAFT_39887 [Dichotomopilus funicola]|uniref:Uncharacterized protein n=1 Tax=Dichotomopilus funicola TaxID=1934379 RepID=A0AAN6UYW2_9PEZI|nr:hypothetical protein C8A04DRAFT_39887 [Dichotomopilus funicola]
MSPTNEDDQHYQPKDTVHGTLREGAVFGGVGTLFAAVMSSLAKKNVGPWATFTKHGGTIVIFAATGASFNFGRDASANLREKEDHWNDAVGGALAGAVMGLRFGRISRVVGTSALVSATLAVYQYTGNSLRGYWNRPEVDEYERKEALRKRYRRPIEETIAEIGEGRGIKAPGYEERRRARLKEKYGIEVQTYSADPNDN